MKIPLFSRLTAKSRGRKVVRASARAIRDGEDDYYEAEPNMKLSHAFMVVLILHIVAVGGIYAFNQIKVHRSPDLISNLSTKIAKVAGAPLPAAAPEAAKPVRLPGDADEPLPMLESPEVSAADVPPAVTTKPAAPVAAVAPAKAPAVPLVTQTSPAKAPAKPAATAKKAAAPVVSGAATYKVAKGDNPYTIAKKLGTSSRELLEVNGITDPTKLQIGQVLKVPGKKS